MLKSISRTVLEVRWLLLSWVAAWDAEMTLLTDLQGRGGPEVRLWACKSVKALGCPALNQFQSLEDASAHRLAVRRSQVSGSDSIALQREEMFTSSETCRVAYAGVEASGGLWHESRDGRGQYMKMGPSHEESQGAHLLTGYKYYWRCSATNPCVSS